MAWMSWVFILALPMGGLVFAGLTTYLKYRQHRAMLDVLKIYAERGEAPPEQVLAALTKGFSLAQPGVTAPNPLPQGPPRVQGAAHYWSLVGLFSVFTVGFAYAAWASGSYGYPFVIVAFTMGAVAVWAMIMAVAMGRSKT